jgi:hypothetical protein
MSDYITKKCSKCGEEKPATTDYFKKGDPYHYQYGVRGVCKVCESNAAKERRQTPEGQKRQREYHEKNRDARNAKSREYYQAHRDEFIKKARQYAIDNREKMREWERRYRRKTHHISSYNRRSRKALLPVSFSAEQWIQCLDYWHHRCAVCGRPRGLWHTLAAEHWIAVADPRPDNPGNVPWNIVPMCHARKGSNGLNSCNTSKGDKDPIAWLFSYYNKERAANVLKKIQDYFEWAKNGGYPPFFS